LNWALACNVMSSRQLHWSLVGCSTDDETVQILPLCRPKFVVFLCCAVWWWTPNLPPCWIVKFAWTLTIHFGLKTGKDFVCGACVCDWILCVRVCDFRKEVSEGILLSQAPPPPKKNWGTFSKNLMFLSSLMVSQFMTE